MGFSGVACSTPADIVDAFGEYFSSEDVKLALRKTKNSFASGSDGISGFVVRDCADILSTPLLAAEEAGGPLRPGSLPGNAPERIRSPEFGKNKGPPSKPTSASSLSDLEGSPCG
ncbi:hypothetical protein Trydic_g5661 [Trypoxylus dichotomus]